MHAGIQLFNPDNTLLCSVPYGKFGNYKNEDSVNSVSGYLNKTDENYIFISPTMEVKEFFHEYDEQQKNELLKGIILINGSEDNHIMGAKDFLSSVPVCVVKKSDGDKILNAISDQIICCKIVIPKPTDGMYFLMGEVQYICLCNLSSQLCQVQLMSRRSHVVSSVTYSVLWDRHVKTANPAVPHFIQ